MGIRIQPKEIEVPEDDPFKHDLLGREKPVEILTHLIGSVEGPCVLAIDAVWGTGKTTFIRMWSQYMQNKNFPVIEFNAWENDFAGDPFVALSAELTDGLNKYTDKGKPLAQKIDIISWLCQVIPWLCQVAGYRVKSTDKDKPLAQKIDTTKKAAAEVLRRAAPGVLRAATAGILDVSPLIEKEIGQALASYAEERLAKYQETKDSVKAFKKSLKEIACELMKPRDGQPGRPLVVIIDELDRCRPSYAVELLEVAKHLCAVDNIIFVLAVNRSQLAHSIRALYGSDFDAEGYLRRFFDLDFQLPDPGQQDFQLPDPGQQDFQPPDPGQQVLTNGRHKFIDALLKETHIGQYFNTHSIFRYACTLLRVFFGTPSVSLRMTEQAIHRLGLVFASLPRDQQTLDSGRWPRLMLAAIIALIMRTLDLDRYREFIRGELSDEEMIKLVYSWPGAEDLQQQYAYLRPSVEATIIIACQERTNSSILFQKYYDPKNAQNLNASRYRERPPEDHEEKLRDQINYLWNRRNGIGFWDIVQRLELLSPDFLNEGSSVSSSA